MKLMHGERRSVSLLGGDRGTGSPKINQGHQNQTEGEGEQIYSDETLVNTHLV